MIKYSIVMSQLHPSGEQYSIPAQFSSNFKRWLPQYPPLLPWVIPPGTTDGHYTLSAEIPVSLQGLPELSAVVQKNMLLNHLHDLQAEILYPILCLIQSICNHIVQYIM